MTVRLRGFRDPGRGRTDRWELKRFHRDQRKKPLQHFYVVAFSDGKPDSTFPANALGVVAFSDRKPDSIPASAGAGIFLQTL
jgi:hypothetical protein